MTEHHEVTYFTLSNGESIDAALLICPECHQVDLDVDIDASALPYRATDGDGHTWTFWPTSGNARPN